MRQILTADCETDPFLYDRIPAPFLWGLYDGSIFSTYPTTDLFMSDVRNMDGIIYAHNAGKFDWHFLIPYLEPDTPLMIINGRIAKFKIGKAEFRDSFLILPFALAQYNKTVIDYGKFEPDVRHLYADEIRDYLRDDCAYLYELVSGFIAEYGLNLTVAATAFSQWRTISGRKTPSTNLEFYDMIKPYYYGGRVQCFQTGIIQNHFQFADINSAYPYAMTHDHPYGETVFIDDCLPDTLPEIQRSFITINTVSRGHLPFRADDGLGFPDDGVVRTFNITGWEYCAALELGNLESGEIIDVLTLPETINFTPYVDHFYNLKKQAKKQVDTDVYLYAKFLLNSLYGKYGANPAKYDEFKVVEPQYSKSESADSWLFASMLGKHALLCRKLPEYKHQYYNVAVSASITGFVRAYMMRALAAVDTPYYCDTDSIACKSTNKLHLSDNLGDWSIDATCDYGAIAGKKLYAFHQTDGKYKTASKGVRLSAAEIIKIAKGHTVTYYPDVPTFSVKTGIRFTPRIIQKT